MFALAYRAVNTCDSMVGYRNQKYERFGFASAKLDDLLNWLPSRLTAIAMFLSMKPRKVSRKQAVSIVLRDAKKHPSPNSGWGEAAAAAIIGVQLGEQIIMTVLFLTEQKWVTQYLSFRQFISSILSDL